MDRDLVLLPDEVGEERILLREIDGRCREISAGREGEREGERGERVGIEGGESGARAGERGGGDGGSALTLPSPRRPHWPAPHGVSSVQLEGHQKVIRRQSGGNHVAPLACAPRRLERAIRRSSEGNQEAIRR